MQADGTNQRRLSTSPYDKSRVSWLPHGDELLVSGNQGQLVRLDVASGTETPISAPLAGIQDAIVSPDGGRIAFSLSTAESIDDNNIWIMNIDGSMPRKLTNMPALQHEPSWHPDGQSLYFVSGPGGQSHDIWRLSLVDKRTEQLTVGQLYNFNVAVAPTGEIAFSSNRSGNYEIWRWLEGTEPQALTRDPGLDAAPTFSPDGQSLIFESSRGGTLNLWRVGLKGDIATDPVQLTFHTVGARAPAWAPFATERR